jgi:hypothetical protein
MSQQEKRYLSLAITSQDTHIEPRMDLYDRLNVLGLDPNPIDPQTIQHLRIDTKDILGYFRMDQTLQQE